MLKTTYPNIYGMIVPTVRERIALSRDVATITHPPIAVFPKGTLEEALGVLGLSVDLVFDKDNGRKQYLPTYIIGNVPIADCILTVTWEKLEQGYISDMKLKWTV